MVTDADLIAEGITNTFADIMKAEGPGVPDIQALALMQVAAMEAVMKVAKRHGAATPKRILDALRLAQVALEELRSCIDSEPGQRHEKLVAHMKRMGATPEEAERLVATLFPKPLDINPKDGAS